ncbi:MAG: type I DNA topoisomerase [Oscillospiraceae bacterium]|jgi:DNA topoisomerase-1|nr:type I DNA topoisomerase [Oscillospiraceae bacterium]
MAGKTNLVIVESPAKAKTIEKYLGAGYKVAASMGHMRDLPKSKFGVDIEAGWVPDYQVLKGKEHQVAELRSAVKKSDKVYLATDPDREGEAIAWHLKEMLELPDSKALRVTFNEITKKVVTDSIQSPRALDMDLVDAQQARRILDRVVGYELSPVLWKKVRRNLSAGRVQSATTKMVCDREAEIRAFIPEEYWELDAALLAGTSEFTAHFYGADGVSKQQTLRSQEETDAVIAAVRDAAFTVKSIKRGERRQNPPPPFATSTMQQDASRRLNFAPYKTMSVAQVLYESGLITYMRTDSLRISPEAQASARAYIGTRYGQPYVPSSPNAYKSKANAQDAHEAIRPSDPTLTPENAGLNGDNLKLYRLIWSRFMASQMTPAVHDTVTLDSVAAGWVFRATESALKFPGFLAAYDELNGESKSNSKKPLPPLKDGDPLKLKSLSPQQKFTQPPARYTEDSLIRAMEEQGIGRPSTYAPTISTIERRDYVVKEGKALKPTPLGETVNLLMEDRFPNIVDAAFTAQMESLLDGVEDGTREWKAVLSDFYRDFRPLVVAAEDIPRYKVPVEETDEICELCGMPMVIKSGRFGRFLSCSGFPECKGTRPLTETMPGQCPKCGGRILKRESKKGARKYTFFTCEKGKDECGFLTFDVPTEDICPECGKTMYKKPGKGAHKSFCATEGCPLFLPEDQRGGRTWKKKQASDAAVEPPDAAIAQSADTKSTATKKSTAKKPAAKTAAKKPAAKTTTKPTAKKTTAAKETA